MAVVGNNRTKELPIINDAKAIRTTSPRREFLCRQQNWGIKGSRYVYEVLMNFDHNSTTTWQVIAARNLLFQKKILDERRKIY